ncbi:MAG: cell division protein FtsA [Aquificae bacterium]|nr:cell division protein FtsA [Aquificota bacterium]
MKRLAALDVGTQKIVYLIGERDSYGDIHILGFGETRARGIQKGVINDLAEAKASILKALKDAEEMAGVKVREVIYGISGGTLKNETVKSQNVKDTITISSGSAEIEESHINRLLDRCLMKSKEDGYEIVYYIPRKYILDEQGEVKNPLGLVGSKLSAEVHVVKVSTTIIRNLEKAITEVGLSPVNRSVNAIASADAVLTTDEKEDGVLVLDIGAGLTDYTLFLEGRPYITGVVPFGGINITKDLSYMLKIDNEEAEKLKVKHGEAYVKNVREEETIKIKPRGENREIPIQKKYIAEIIQSRVEEIFDHVVRDIERRGGKLSLINSGIVITGGSANLRGLKELIEDKTNLPVRIGRPSGIIGLKERVDDPRYSTVVGLLKQGFLSSGFELAESPNKKKSGFFKGIVDKFRSLFEDLL